VSNPQETFDGNSEILQTSGPKTSVIQPNNVFPRRWKISSSSWNLLHYWL